MFHKTLRENTQVCITGVGWKEQQDIQTSFNKKEFIGLCNCKDHDSHTIIKKKILSLLHVFYDDIVSD